MKRPMLALHALAALALVVALGPRAAHADTTVADTSEYFAPGPGSLARHGLAPYADLRMRADQVRNRPGVKESLERADLRLRGGLTWARPGFPLRAEGGALVTWSSDRWEDSWAAFQNEPVDTLDVDRASLGVTSAFFDATLGKLRPRLALTEMVWDPDLRPVGLIANARVTGLGATAGYVTRSRFDVDDGRVAIAQLRARWREQATTSAELVASYLAFDHMAALSHRGLARQNAARPTPLGPTYTYNYRLVDLQLGAHATAGMVPIAARLDVVRNVAIARDREGARAQVVLGGSGVPAGLTLGWAYERVEREAVPGAFNSDDWWFHSRLRGHRAWLIVGDEARLSAELSASIEWRDDLAQETKRLMARVRVALPER